MSFPSSPGPCVVSGRRTVTCVTLSWRFAPQPDLTTLLQHIGFTDISAETLSGGITTLYEARKPSLRSPTPQETLAWQPIGA